MSPLNSKEERERECNCVPRCSSEHCTGCCPCCRKTGRKQNVALTSNGRVKRYDVAERGSDELVVESANGDYVVYEDVKAEIGRLQGAEYWKAEHLAAVQENERLRSVLERVHGTLHMYSRETADAYVTDIAAATRPAQKATAETDENHECWLAETWQMIEECAKDSSDSHRVSLSAKGCAALLAERRSNETGEQLWGHKDRYK